MRTYNGSKILSRHKNEPDKDVLSMTLSEKEPVSCKSQSTQSETGIEGMANPTILQVECRARLWPSSNCQAPDGKDGAVKKTLPEHVLSFVICFSHITCSLGSDPDYQTAHNHTSKLHSA